ncbi:MAG: hypothetical protein K9N49_08435, partial [Candidatus Marinimicrobia bacterium]|nr:hypothetical protein [Candidatus Neomarinimicrobiota bacterium]
MTRPQHAPRSPRPPAPATRWGLAIGLAAGLGGLLLLGTIGVAWNRPDSATALTRTGWPSAAADAILRNRTVALLHGALASLLAAAGLWLLTAPRWRGTAARRWTPLVLVLLVAADARWLAR